MTTSDPSKKAGFSKPPRTTAPPTTPEEFVAGGVSEEVQTFPWDGLNNKRAIPLFNLRLTECKAARLKYASDNSEFSMHQIVADATERAVNEIIEKLLKE